MHKSKIIVIYLIFSFLSAQANSLLAPQNPKSLDITLDKGGRLTVIEYSSLSCGGCAYFAKEILPFIEKEYVETGKVKFIFRHMVMHPNDVKATMLVCCSKNPYELQLAYWKRQHEWAGVDDDNAIQRIAQDYGMTASQINACLVDAQLRQSLFAKKFVALKGYNIKAIPAIFINNKEYSIHTLEDFRKTIEQVLKEDHNKTN